MTAPILSKEHAKRLANFREFYESHNAIGLLKFLSEQSGLRRNQICSIAKGKRGALIDTVEKLEAAQKAFLKKHAKTFDTRRKRV